MSESDRERWDAKYAERSVPGETLPDEWLSQRAASLKPGRALDLACGLGHNSIWLAQRGWQVDAVDISPVGLKLAASAAERQGLQINWQVADLDTYLPANRAYDLVLVFRFLERVHLPRIILQALKPGGILLYETFTAAHLARSDNHLKNSAFALQLNELPQLFPGLDVLEYAEVEDSERCVARFWARSP